MTSYAPLFARKNATNWNPDLIYFDNERPFLTCSYYVQQMFGKSSGQYYYGDCVTFKGDKAGDGSQLRPFIVWFGEAVPEIETAVRYVEKADIFVIIGTSMNVYPAASLLYYVPSDAEVYLIDPKDVNINSRRPITHIKKGASEGMKELLQLLAVGN